MPTIPRTPNLGLYLVPDGYDLSDPLWSQYLNANSQALDALGQPFGVNKFNIDGDLSFNNFSALALKTAQFQNQGGTLASSFLRAAYFANGDFWINNGAGVSVQITSGSSLAAPSGNIAGLPSTPAGAGVTYSNALGFVFLGFGADKYAPLQAGPVAIYDTASGPASHPVVLKSPASLAATYGLTLLTALPAATLPLLCDNTGQISTGKITRAQLSAQNLTALIPITPGGWNWSGYWWQDQTGMVHLRGTLTGNNTGSFPRNTGLFIPVAPYADGTFPYSPPIQFQLVVTSGANSNGPAFVAISSTGEIVVNLPTIAPGSFGYQLDAITYLGAN